jgi:hypothetical protein
MEPKNRFQGIHSASLCSLAGRYDNPIPTWFLAPTDCLKIPALFSVYSLGFAVCDLEVECEPGDEHVCLETDLVNAGRRQGNSQADETEYGDGTLLRLQPQGMIKTIVLKGK